MYIEVCLSYLSKYLMHVAKNYWFNWFFGLWTFPHRFDVGTMLHVFELNVKNPAFAKQKNISNSKGFLWRTKSRLHDFPFILKESGLLVFASMLNMFKVVEGTVPFWFLQDIAANSIIHCPNLCTSEHTTLYSIAETP